MPEEKTDATDGEPAASDSPASDSSAAGTGAASVERRALIVARAGPHRLGLFADEADGVSQFAAAPAPLPFAPPAVLGVVALRGRMRTLIDPLPLLQSPAASAPQATLAPPATPGLALLIKGDEQLALAVEQVERTTEITFDAIAPLEPARDFARGTIILDGSAVIILEAARLFEAVMRGHERRRVR